ncbi:phosphoribosylanthranilate isomerase [soil metagenome]
MFVKVCGTTSEEDALLAVAVGADALGFIFAPSPRQVAVERVRSIVSRLPPEVLTVGVFRDEAPSRVVELVHRGRVKAAQLHGHEGPEDTRYVHEHVPIVFKSFSAGDPEVASAADHGADAILLDAAVPGSGAVFDWRLAEDAPERLRLVLAGGLGPDNVASAIERVRPWGVDACSGLEASPGRKDPAKLRAFLSAARAAAPSEHHGGEERPYDWESELLSSRSR